MKLSGMFGFIRDDSSMLMKLIIWYRSSSCPDQYKCKDFVSAILTRSYMK